MAENERIFTIKISGVETSIRNVGELNKAIKVLSTQEDSATDNIKSLSKELNVLYTATNKDAVAILNLETQLKSYNDTLIDVNKSQEALTSFSDDIKPSVNSLQSLTDRSEELKTSLKDVEIGSVAFRELTLELIQVNNKIKDVEKSFEGLDLEGRLKAFLDFGQGVTDSFAGAANTVSLFTGEIESAGRIQQTIEKASTILNTARAVSEVLVQGKMAFRTITQKLLNVVSKDYLKIQKEINATGSKGLDLNAKSAVNLKDAVGGATGATQALGSATGSLAKAGPYGALAAGVLALTAGIGLAVNETGEFNSVLKQSEQIFNGVIGYATGLALDIKNIFTDSTKGFKNLGDEAKKAYDSAVLKTIALQAKERLQKINEVNQKERELQNQQLSTLASNIALSVTERNVLNNKILDNTKKNSKEQIEIYKQERLALNEELRLKTINNKKYSDDDIKRIRENDLNVKKALQDSADAEFQQQQNIILSRTNQIDIFYNKKDLIEEQNSIKNEQRAAKDLFIAKKNLDSIKNVYAKDGKKILDAKNEVDILDEKRQEELFKREEKRVYDSIQKSLELYKLGGLDRKTFDENNLRDSNSIEKLKFERQNYYRDRATQKELENNQIIKDSQDALLDERIKSFELFENTIEVFGDTLNKQNIKQLNDFQNETNLNFEKQALNIQKTVYELEKEKALIDTLTSQSKTLNDLKEVQLFKEKLITKEQNIQIENIEIEKDKILSQSKIEEANVKNQLKLIKIKEDANNEVLKQINEQSTTLSANDSIIAAESIKNIKELNNEKLKINKEFLEKSKEFENKILILNLQKDEVDQKAIDDKFKLGKATALAYANGFDSIKLTDRLSSALIKGFDIPKNQQDIFLSSINKLYDGVTSLFNNSINLIASLNNQALLGIDNQIKAIDDSLTSLQENLDISQKNYDDSLASIANIETNLADARSSKRDELLGQLDSERSKTQELFDEVKRQQGQEKKLTEEKIRLQTQRDEKAKESAQLQINLQKAQTLVTLATATANAIEAVTKQGSLLFPFNLIAIASTIGAISAGLATVAAFTAEDGGQLTSDGKVQKFANGGVIKGNSHKNGGVNGTGAFNNIQAEGGEFIVNKLSTAKYLPQLIRINNSKYANGGILPNNPSLYDNISNNSNIISSQLNEFKSFRNENKANVDKPVYISVVELNNVNNSLKIIENKAKI